MRCPMVELWTCDYCRGEGEYEFEFADETSEMRDCEKCNGEGFSRAEHDRECEWCFSCPAEDVWEPYTRKLHEDIEAIVRADALSRVRKEAQGFIVALHELGLLVTPPTVISANVVVFVVAEECRGTVAEIGRRRDPALFTQYEFHFGANGAWFSLGVLPFHAPRIEAQVKAALARRHDHAA